MTGSSGPAAPGRPTARCSGDAGLSLVELLITATVLLVALTAAFTATVTSSRVAARTVSQGTATDRAMTVVGELQSLLSGAVVPALLPTTVQSDCSGSATGAAFPSGQGPFVVASSTSVALCTLRPGATTAYTEDVAFSSCAQSSMCTLTVSQWPAPSGGSATTIYQQTAVSDATSPVAPFVYEQATAAGWAPTTVDAAIEAVQLTVATGASGGATTTVQRVVLLPNTLPGTDKANT